MFSEFELGIIWTFISLMVTMFTAGNIDIKFNKLLYLVFVYFVHIMFLTTNMRLHHLVILNFIIFLIGGVFYAYGLFCNSESRTGLPLLEFQLTKRDLFIYCCLSTLFSSQMYFAFLVSVIAILIPPNFRLLWILLMFLFHLFLLVSDPFFALGFNETLVRLKSQKHGEPKINFENYDEEKTDREILELYAFAIFVEDGDYLSRIEPRLTIRHFISYFYQVVSSNFKWRKPSIQLLKYYITKINFRNIKYFITKINVQKIKQLIGSIKIQRIKHYLANIYVVKIKPHIRGYSTIQQQLLRRFGLGEYSYSNVIRRKILFEHIYVPFFLKALTNRDVNTNFTGRTARRNKNNRMYIQKRIKWFLLKLYYHKILGNPAESGALTYQLGYQSRLKEKGAQQKWFEFKLSFARIQIMDQLEVLLSEIDEFPIK